MPDYSVYDPRAAKDAALDRLMEMGRSRQRFTDDMYRRAEEERMAAEAEAADRGANLNRSAMDEAAMGASMGAMGGPMGAGIGGAIGSAIGAIKGYGQRRKDGQGKWGAALRSIGDGLTGGIFSAGHQATQGKYDSLMAGLPMLAGAGAMAGKHFMGSSPKPAYDGATQTRINENNARMENKRFDAEWKKKLAGPPIRTGSSMYYGDDPSMGLG